MDHNHLFYYKESTQPNSTHRSYGTGTLFPGWKVLVDLGNYSLSSSKAEHMGTQFVLLHRSVRLITAWKHGQRNKHLSILLLSLIQRLSKAWITLPRYLPT